MIKVGVGFCFFFGLDNFFERRKEGKKGRSEEGRELHEKIKYFV